MMYVKWSFVVIILILVGCKRQAEQIELPDGLNADVQMGEGIRMVYTDSARVRMVLTSPHMDIYDEAEGRMEFWGGVYAEFFDEQEKKIAELNGRKATRYDRQAIIIIEDSVVLTKIDGDQLESSQLIWDERHDRVHTDRFVKITRGEEKYYGFGFEATNNFKTFSILKSTGQMFVDDPN